MCCRNRQRAFVKSSVVEAVREEFLRPAYRHQFAVLAYTFMPDHAHLLVEGLSEQADFRRWAMLVRRRTTMACQFVLPNGLWQDGYYERALRKSEDVRAMIDYILDNPVRAGLVSRPLDYPFSWSCTLDG